MPPSSSAELFNLHQLLSDDHDPVSHPTEDASLTSLQLRSFAAGLATNGPTDRDGTVRGPRALGSRPVAPTIRWAVWRAVWSEPPPCPTATPQLVAPCSEAVLDELPTARTTTANGAGLVEAVSPDFIEAKTTAYLSMVLVTLDLFDEAEDYGRQALTLPGLARTERSKLRTALSQVALARDDLVQARHRILELRELDQAAGDSWRLVSDEILLADVEVRMDTSDRAHARLAAVFPRVPQLGDIVLTIEFASDTRRCTWSQASQLRLPGRSGR